MRSIILHRTILTLGLALALPLVLSGCGKSDDNGKELAALDDSLAGKQVEPAVADALQDQIVVDPQLTNSANGNAVRNAGRGPDGSLPADSGYNGAVATAEELDMTAMMSAPEPRVATTEDCGSCSTQGQATTLGARAREQTAGRGKGTCDAKLTYAMDWANRMPPEFPVYPKGRVKEAAGVDGGLCDIRVVSFTTATPMKKVVDYYYTRARKSGFSAEYLLRDGEHVLGGVRDVDDGAYFITFARRSDGGTAIDIVANNGR